MIKELFEKACELKKLDDKIQRVSNDYFGVIASWSYPPIVENVTLWAFLECLKICNKPSGCTDIDTHTICKVYNPDSYNKLNKYFQ